MKIHRFFTIIVSISAVALFVANAGCQSVKTDDKIVNKVENFSLEPYKQLISSSNRVELLPLIEAAVAKHADSDLAKVKSLVADEKLLATKYADLEARIKNHKFHSREWDRYSLFHEIAISNQSEEFKNFFTQLLNADIPDYVDNPYWGKSHAKLENTKNMLMGNVASIRSYIKEANEVSDVALAFYASRRYEDISDADLSQRVKENIAARVQSLFLLAAERQKVLNRYITLLEDCRSRYDLIEKLKKSRQITPFRAVLENERYEEMEYKVKESAFMLKVISHLLSQYTGVNAENGEYLLVDDSILSSWILPDSDTEGNGCGEIILKYAELQDLATLSRRELAFFNNQKLINAVPFVQLADKELTSPYYYMDTIISLVEFKNDPSRYDWYFYPDKTEFEKRAPMLLDVLANVKVAHSNVEVTDKEYRIAFQELRKAEKDFVNYLVKENALDVKSNHFEKIDRKAVSDLTSLDIDAKRFALAKLEDRAMEKRSNSYDAWIMLLTAVGDKEITSKSVIDARKNLKNYASEAGKEFTPKAAGDEVKEVSPDVIPTVRFIDVDYIGSYPKK